MSVEPVPGPASESNAGVEELPADFGCDVEACDRVSLSGVRLRDPNAYGRGPGSEDRLFRTTDSLGLARGRGHIPHSSSSKLAEYFGGIRFQ